MRFRLTVLIFFIFLSGSVAGTHPVENSISTEHTVTDDSYRYYLDDGKVAYQSVIRSERVDGEIIEKPLYENVSVEKFAAMKATDAATERLEQHLVSELDVDELEGVSIGTVGDETHYFAVEPTYHVSEGDENDESGFSYSEMQEAAPDSVSVKVSFEGRTETVEMPVRTEKADLIQQDLAYAERRDKGTGSQGGGSSDGETWTLDVTKLNTTCWSESSTEKVRDVRFSGEDSKEGKRVVTFRGSVDTANPCQEIASTELVKKNGNYRLDIVTNATGEECIDCVGQLNYKAKFSANRDFRLEVAHNGEKVDTVEHPGYDEEKEKNFIEMIVEWIGSLFGNNQKLSCRLSHELIESDNGMEPVESYSYENMSENAQNVVERTVKENGFVTEDRSIDSPEFQYTDEAASYSVNYQNETYRILTYTSEGCQIE